MRHASRHNTAKYSALVRHEFCWAVESITCMSPGTHCHAQPTLLSFTRPCHWKTSRSHGSGCPDLIQVLRYLKMDNATKATDTQVLDDVYISPG